MKLPDKDFKWIVQIQGFKGKPENNWEKYI